MTRSYYASNSVPVSAVAILPSFEFSHSLLRGMQISKTMYKIDVEWHRSIILLVRPGHGVVAGNKRRGPVEQLSFRTAPCVEDGSVQRAGHGALAVVRQAVGGDALLGGSPDGVAPCCELGISVRRASARQRIGVDSGLSASLFGDAVLQTVPMRTSPMRVLDVAGMASARWEHEKLRVYAHIVETPGVGATVTAATHDCYVIGREVKIFERGKRDWKAQQEQLRRLTGEFKQTGELAKPLADSIVEPFTSANASGIGEAGGTLDWRVWCCVRSRSDHFGRRRPGDRRVGRGGCPPRDRQQALAAVLLDRAWFTA